MNPCKSNVETTEVGEIKPFVGFMCYGDSMQLQGVTEHKIKDGKLSAGRVISLDKMINKLTTSPQTKTQFIPDNVLVDNARTLVWFVTSKKRPIWFRKGKDSSLVVHYPNLVFIFDRKQRSLRVGATATKSRPNAKTKVYHPPLMNINDGLVLCQGSARLPAKVDYESFEKVQDTLFNSWFSHKNTSKLAKGVETDEQLIKLWKEHSLANKPIRAKQLIFKARLGDLLGS